MAKATKMLDAMKHLTLSDILIRTYGNQTEAARLLNVDRNTVAAVYKNKRLNVVLETPNGLVLLLETRAKNK